VCFARKCVCPSKQPQGRAPKWLPPQRPQKVSVAIRRTPKQCSFWRVPGCGNRGSACCVGVPGNTRENLHGFVAPLPWNRMLADGGPPAIGHCVQRRRRTDRREGRKATRSPETRRRRSHKRHVNVATPGLRETEESQRLEHSVLRLSQNGYGCLHTGDLRLIKLPLPQRVASDLGQKLTNPRRWTDPRHPDSEASDARDIPNPLNMH
jgi:hypothetical protein